VTIVEDMVITGKATEGQFPFLSYNAEGLATFVTENSQVD
jgi:hypothetical protein